MALPAHELKALAIELSAALPPIASQGGLTAHVSALFPLPEGNFAHVLVQDSANAPRYVPGDVLLVNLDVTAFVADGLYAVELNGRQLIRYLRDCGDGLVMFSGSAPQHDFKPPHGFRILGMAESAAQIRRIA